MATTYEYIISLQDKASATMQRISGASAETVTRLTALSERSRALNRTTTDLGGSIFNLKQKIDLLQQEKELINPSNLPLIRRYNREIAGLERQINSLDNAGNGGRLKGYFSEIGATVKGIFNPVTIGAAAIGFAGKSALDFGDGMAKVNITAQLDEKGLGDLQEKLKKIAKDNRADVTVVPTGFEKIISQTGDVDASLQILDASLKGSKAGFVDLDTVTGALAQTLSIVGTKNASAQEVLDTFFAAKRVGAGEFKDFAAYVPSLIASADSLGVNYKSVAGTFAYMTGKGQDAARASVLMGNMFSVLGKTDITANLGKAGVKIFDTQGKIRGMVDIFKDLGNVMAGMNDEQKSGFLEKIGITDKEAKSAFAIMGSDIEKLSTAMLDTAAATGETAAALEFSKNPLQKATELWNNFKGMGLEVGTAVLPLVNVGLDVLGGILSGLSMLLSGVTSFFSGWAGALLEGNPIVWGLTAAIVALTGCYIAYKSSVIAATIASQAKTVWDGITTGATAVMTAAQWAYNTSLYACPIVWIVAAIAALVAAIVWAWNNFEGFRKVVLGVWETIKAFGKMLWDSLVTVIRNIIGGLGSLGSAIGKLFTGDFAGAAKEAKDGVEKLWNANPIVATVKTAVKTDWSGAWEKGTQAGADSWAKSQSEKSQKAAIGNAAKNEMVIPVMPDVPGIPAEPENGTDNYTSLMKKLGGKKKEEKGKQASTLDLNEVVPDYKKSGTYTAAVAQRLETVKIPSTANPIPSLVKEATKIPGTPPVKRETMPPLPDTVKMPAMSPVNTMQDKTDYQDNKNNRMQQISGDIQKILSSVGTVAATLQRIAAMAAIPVTVALSGTSQQQPRPETDTPGTGSPYTAASAMGAPVRSRPAMERFCDNINITIQQANSQGMEQIRQEITETLKQAFDDYEA